MSAGCLCIASNNTAMGDYVTKENSIIIEPCGKVPARDGKWFFGDGNWSDFKQEDIIEALIEAKDNSYEQKRTQAQITANKFNWDNTAKSIKEVLYG
jgi:glycosyltransferase involved in cell wall biosynthesis